MNLDVLYEIDAERLISSVESFLSDSSSFLPAEFGISALVHFSLILICFMLILGILFRIFLGKHCKLNQAISCFFGLLIIYGITVSIYALNPLNIARFLSPLPFAVFRKDILIFVPFFGSETTLLCEQILSLITLCFIIHIAGIILPFGGSFISWLLTKLISIPLIVFLNLSINWVISVFLPDGIAVYAPAVLLAILGIALLVGLFNPLLCVIFTVANPVLGLLYTFFFSNIIGKQITKACLSACLFCALLFSLEYLGYSVIDITQKSIALYIPFSILLVPLWYFFDKKI